MLLLVLTSGALGLAAAEAGDGAPASRWYGRWIEAAPAEVGYDPVRLGAAISAIGEMRGVQGLLLLRHGYLVAERYWRGGAPDVPHNLKSASKSVMSALAGIAIDRGYFSLDQPVTELLSERAAVKDTAKRGITVRHLLTMTSGLRSTSYQAYNTWVNRPDWVKSALAEPLQASPGERYDYNTANTHLLSAILAARTGRSTRDFAQRELFGPMGIEIHDWLTDPDGIHIGGNNLWLMPRDLAKFGQLYLDRGRWGDRQLVPADWVAESTAPAGKGRHETYGGYGYLWWTPNGDGSFAAVGYGGQYILDSPRDDTVVVILSTQVSKGDHWEGKLFDLLRSGIGGSLVEPGLPITGVTTAEAGLRSGPRDDGRVLGKLPAGSPVELFGREAGWVRVRSRGTEGWLAEAEVSAGASQSRPVPQAVPLSGPGVLTGAPPAGPDAVTIPRSRLETLQTRAEALDDLVHAPAPLPRYRTTGVVNFRRSPHLLGNLIGKLEKGTQFQALERSEAWLMARIDGEQGWVHSDFAEVVQRPSPKARREAIAAEVEALAGQIRRLEETTDSMPVAATPGGRPGSDQTALIGLQATNRQLQQQLREAERRLEDDRREAADARDRLEDELAALRERAETLSAALEKLGADRGRQEDALAAVAAEGERLSNELAANSASAAETEEALRQSKALGESLSAELGRLEQEKQALQQRLDGLAAVEQERAGVLEGREREIAQLQEGLEKANARREALERQLTDATGRRAALEARLGGVEQDNRRLKEELAQTLEASVVRDQLVEELRETGRKARTALDESRGEVTTLRAALEEAQRAKDGLSGELAGLRQQLEHGNAALAALGDADRERQGQLAEAREQARRLQAALDETTARQAATAEALEAGREENRTLQRQLAEGEAREQRQLAALSEAQQKAADIASQLSTRDGELRAARSEFASLLEKTRVMQDELVAIGEAGDERLEQLQQGRARIAALEMQLADVESERTAVDGRRRQAELQNASLAQALTGAWLTQGLAVSDIDRLRNAAQQQQTRIDELQRENAERLQEAAEGAARAAALERELSAAKSVNDRLRTDTARLQEQEAELDRKLAEAHSGIDSSQQRIAALEEALNQRQDENERLQAEAARQQAAGESQSRLLAELREAGRRDAKALSEANGRVSELAASVEQAGIREQELVAALGQANAARASQQVLIEELRGANTRNLAELEMIRQAVDVQQRQLAQQEADQASRAAALQSAQEAITGLEKKLAASVAAREESEQEMSAQARQRQAEIDGLTGRLAESQAAEARLGEQLETTRAELARTETSLLGERESVAALNEDLRRRRDENAVQQQRLADLQTVEEQLQVTRTQLAVLRRAVDAGQQESGRLLADVQRLEEADRERLRKMENLLAREEQRVAELAAAGEEIAALRQAVTQKQASLESLQATLDESRRQADAKLAEAIDARDLALAEAANLEALRVQERTAGQARLAGVVQERDRALTELAGLTKALAQERAVGQALLADVERLQAVDRQRQQDIGRQTVELSAASEEIAALRETVAQRQASVESLQATLDEARRDGDTKLAEAGEARDRALSEVAGLQKALAEQAASGDDALAQVVEERDRALTEVAGLKEALGAQAADGQLQLAAVAEARDRASSEVVELKKTLAERTASAQAELKEASEARDRALSEVGALQAALAQERAVGQALLADVERLEASDRERLQKLKGLLASGERRAAELSAAGEEIAALRETVAQRQASVESLQATLDESLRQADARLAEAGEARDRALAEVAGLKEALGAQVADGQLQLASVAEARDHALAEVAGLKTRLAGEEPGGRVKPAEAADAAPVVALEASVAPVPPPKATLPGDVRRPAGVTVESTIRVAGLHSPAESLASEKPTGPVREPAAAAATPAPPAAGVEQFVRDWAAIWSRQDVEGYLARYADDFRPADGGSRADWAAQRHHRLTRPKVIDVEVSGFEVAVLDERRARVTFDQAYRANHYRDRVRKTLDLVHDGDTWKILSETSRPQPLPPVAARQ